VNRFNEIMDTVYNNSFPLKLSNMPKKRKKSGETWFDHELRNMRNNIDRKARKNRLHRNRDIVGEINALKKEYRRKIKHKQSLYYGSLFANLSVKDKWKKINKLTGRDGKLGRAIVLSDENDELISDQLKVANKLNHHFTTIGPATIDN
jgi:hypothetical protein